ncbi:glutamine amidotransferase [Paracidovorax cattleyae]|uniref:GMP synthase (Glutamine-hydrolysing) n=1 Tax=Paracidovorax cattleyae TaxID=80868 RepID=A0A1H0WKG7_9BURK|nr:glutamine amidotransferase [Paracidovorax cattleyae]AVS72900.1 glutamine amidotransferase [Paracidovorax cattleyae]SDP91137.1 GMP synthase (glutamine-hydrolysing) [Paracidovorax cattleyae]
MPSPPAPLPIVIARTGGTFPALRTRLGDFEDWVRAGLGGTAAPVLTIDAARGDGMPEPASIAGVVVTGSHAMVTDQAPWSEALGGWIARAVALQTPVLGICYGHQLLAHALGGEVADHPGGWEIGTVDVGTVPDATGSDALFAGLPAAFDAQVVHRQSVRRLPAGAVRLAGNAFEPHQAFRVGHCAWGVQFHPEFGPDAMRGYIDTLAADLRHAGRDPGTLRGHVRATPEAAALLGRFGRFCLRNHGPAPAPSGPPPAVG